MSTPRRRKTPRASRTARPGGTVVYDLAAELDSPATTEFEYRRRAARYRRSGLLQLIAHMAAQFSGPQNPRGWLEPAARQYTPWALADVARVSLAASARPRQARVAASLADLDFLLAMHNNLDDPARSDGGGESAVMNLMLRTAAEQFPFQQGLYNVAARGAAVLLHTPFPQGKRPRCITSGWEQELFGTTLSDYVSTARVLWASALHNQGRFFMAYLTGPGADPRLGFLDPASVRRTLDAHFAIAATEFPKADREATSASRTDHRLRRYTYNPLRGRPAVAGLGPDYLCPIPQLVWAKTTLAGLYFTGCAHFGDAFANDLGELVEQYIGQQLGLIREATVIPEISYKQGSQNVRAVDWIVVFNDLVLLVEVKSAAPTAENRLGGPDAWDKAADKLGRGFRQIEKTAAMIKAQHPAFHAIPHDRRVLGLVVTREPFYTANWPHANSFFPTTTVQTAVACIDELESIVTLADTTVDRFLTEIADDPLRHTCDLGTSLPGHTFVPNPVLDRGWRSLPWKPADTTRVARANDEI